MTNVAGFMTRRSVKHVSDLLIIGALLLLSLFIRLPLFFASDVNWDEGTYILMGQSFLDGFDPERDYWGFRGYPYALFILLFGKSIAGIRLAGALCVGLSSCFLFLIGKHILNRQTGLLAGVFFIILSSSDQVSGSLVMAEHIALVPLLAALLLLLACEMNLRLLFFVGGLMGIACIARLNLAYVALAIPIFIFIALHRQSPSKMAGDMLAYGCGFMAIMLLTTLPYVAVKQPWLWWDLNFSFALKYSSSQNTTGQSLPQSIRMIYQIFIMRRSSIGVVVWVGSIGGLITMLIQAKTKILKKKQEFLLLFLFGFSVFVSMIRGGAFYSHYLIQLIPFASLYASIFLAVIMDGQRPFRQGLKWLAIVAIALPVGRSLRFHYYLNGLAFQQSRYDFFNQGTRWRPYGRAYKIGEYLNQYDDLDANLYIMGNSHIAHMFTGTSPLDRVVVHPSAIGKEFTLRALTGRQTTTLDELARILSKEPRFIVEPESTWYLDEKSKQLLQETLDKKYMLVKKISGSGIYARRLKPE